MRPLPGGDALPPVRPRSRKSSVDHPAPPSSHVPTAFFMKREEDLEQSTVVPQSTNTLGRSKESTYGVQSLADTLETAFGPESASTSHLVESRSPQRLHGKSASRTYSHSSAKDFSRSPESSKSSPARKTKRKLSNYGSSVPPPLSNVDASITIISNTIPSTPKSVSLQSMKSSDEDSALDEVASQAIMSSGEEEEQEEVDTQAGASSQSFPQLVMPSIRMPTRRPFTIKGKAMGKLKVMVAGEAGMYTDPIEKKEGASDTDHAQVPARQLLYVLSSRSAKTSCM